MTPDDEVAAAVRDVLDAGAAQDFTRLRAFHAEDAAFSRWSSRPGGELLDAAGTHEEEERTFRALPPGTRIAPEQVRVDRFGAVAVSTFYAVLRNDQGHALRRTRATLVWEHRPEGWRIVHEHLSP